jgi:hypothetical protein
MCEALETIFEKVEKCRESSCVISGRATIFKPDRGMNDPEMEREIFHRSDAQKCDCILCCENGTVHVVEILCGTLKYRDLKHKIGQLENCLKILKKIDRDIYERSKVYLAFDKYASSKKEPKLKEQAVNARVMGKPLLLLHQTKTKRRELC